MGQGVVVLYKVTSGCVTIHHLQVKQLPHVSLA